MHRAPTGPLPLALHTPPVHVRAPQQSASPVHAPPPGTHAARHFGGVPAAAAPHTGDDSQQPPAAKPAVHACSPQPVPWTASQRPRRQPSPVQQSVSALHAPPSIPQMPRHTLPWRLPLAVQYGASAQQPPCAKPCVQIE